MLRFLLTLIPITLAIAQPDRRILVVSASSGDYIWGAGGTLAKFAKEGWRIDVAQFGNDEKRLRNSTPAEARLAGMAEGRKAATLIGVTDIVRMDHKSGELGQVSSTEMRNQLFALIRGMKPKILFIPDPYVHYQDDRDLAWVGHMAEEAWGYSGGGTFANELARMGLAPYGAPEVFYYTPMRPYRAGEGGETSKSKFAARDIAASMPSKLAAIRELGAYNHGWSADRAAAFANDLARTIGAKHGFAFGEEFNHVGAAPDPIPPYALDHARPRRRP